MLNRRLDVLEFRKSQRLSRSSDSVVVPVEVVADRVNRALDVHVRHGGHDNAKLEVVLVTCLESTLLSFAHLVLIACINEIRVHEAHKQHESGLWDEAAETIDDENATRVDAGQFSRHEVEWRSAMARLVKAQQSSHTVSLPSRFDVADL